MIWLVLFIRHLYLSHIQLGVVFRNISLKDMYLKEIGQRTPTMTTIIDSIVNKIWGAGGSGPYVTI